MTTDHDSVQANESPASPSQPLPARTRKEENQRLLLVGLGCLLVGASLVSLVVVFRGGPGTSPEATAAAATASASATPTVAASAEPPPAEAPTATTAAANRPAAMPRGGGGPKQQPPKTVIVEQHHDLTWDQERRLDALKRLCDAGTLSKAECAAKRQAIISEQP